MEEKEVPLKGNNQEIVEINGVKYQRHPSGVLISEKAFVDGPVYVGPKDRIEQGVHRSYERVCLTEEEIKAKIASKENAMIERVDKKADELLQQLEEISGRD